MRMSSGASAAYENPRCGRSSCMLETPRSSRIASARTPLSASWSRTTEASPRRNRDCTPAWRLKPSKYGRTVGSRSIAMKRPSPFRSWARIAAWPPAPNVASTTVCPGSIARSSRTSSARTGTWSVSFGCKTLGNIFCAPFHLFQLLAPRGAVPDLQVVPDASDDDVPAEPSVLDESGRNHHAPLTVELSLGGAGEEEALHPATLFVEGVELGEPRLHERIPVLATIGVEAAVHPAGEHDAGCERRPEAGRQREPVLVVDRVLVFAEKHVWGSAGDSTPPHFRPQQPTSQYQHTIRGGSRGSGRHVPLPMLPRCVL